MRKNIYFYILTLCLIAGFSINSLFALDDKRANRDETMKPISYINLNEASSLEYCNRMKNIIRDIANMFYSSYYLPEESKSINVFFELYSNGKLDESSIFFPKISSNDRALCNIVVLSLKKTFMLYQHPLPKELKSRKKVKFEVTLDFKQAPLLSNNSPSNIGVLMCDIDGNMRMIYGLDSQKGVFIVKVFDDSPAKTAGLKKGDVVYSVNDKAIKDTKSFTNFLKENPGDIVLKTNRGKFFVKRGNQ